MSERRYKLQINTDAEIAVASDPDILGRVDCYMLGVPGVFTVPRHWLKEIPPPIPAEPEPGAYLIGGVPCWHDEAYGWWLGRNHSDGSIWRGVWREWTDVWQTVGGPDVDIVPLVPKPAAVEVPWRGGSGGTTVEVGVPGTVSLTRVTVDGSGGYQFVLGFQATRELGWALLSAADRAEAGE